MADRRINPDRRVNPDHCPVHGSAFAFQEDDNIICVAYGCDFKKVPARREADKKLRTIVEAKDAFQH